MSIEVYPGDRPLAPPPPPTWGEIAPVGKTATVLRVALPDRWVSFPVGQFIHWEHQVGEPELLTIQTAKRSIIVTGRDLADIRIALEQATRCREELARCRQAVADLTALTGKVFEHEERYRELLKRQGELVDLLDITKNQAAAQQAAESTGDVESVAAVPEPGSPSEGESEDETPATSVSVHAALPEPPGIQPIKPRRPVKMDSSQSLAPTVRMTANNTERMRIAI